MKLSDQIRFFSVTLTLFSLCIVSYAQESAHAVVDTLAFQQLQSEMAAARKLKISGYVQAQFQKAESEGVESFAGGNFGTGIDNRFSIRSGRVKFTYDDRNAQAVLQIDITEKGVNFKDVYLKLTDPWLKTLALTGGIFVRPFGYETSYSSTLRESPEYSRIFQTLFPSKRDLGAMLTIQALQSFLRLDLGIFNGNGSGVETDKYKDFIGHLSATDILSCTGLNVGAGVSYYNGGFAAVSTNLYSMKSEDGVPFFQKKSVHVGDRMKREYLGAEIQLCYNGSWGKTQIRTEYLSGTQPGFSNSSSSQTAVASGDAYARKFSGYYTYLVQDILKTPLQAVVKYDVYDPNTMVGGKNIGKTVVGETATGIADIKYKTWGLGMNYQWNKNVRLMAYYDIVSNETSASLGSSASRDYSKDVKDNVFTFRLQYKF